MTVRKTRYWIFIAYLFLLAIGIPWYWPADNTALLLGFPLWVLVSVVVGFLAAVLTAWLFLNSDFEADNHPDS